VKSIFYQKFADRFLPYTHRGKYILQRKSDFLRPLPNADFLSSDWFM